VPVFVLVALLAAAPASSNVDARIAASAAAAQALQGPLDGTWVLADHKGRALYVLQIVDPPSGALQAAWRDPAGALGVASRVRRSGDHLEMTFDASRILSLRRDSGGAWRGRLDRAGRPLAVTLRRADAGFR
jgi:hypothetical protein